MQRFGKRDYIFDHQNYQYRKRIHVSHGSEDVWEKLRGKSGLHTSYFIVIDLKFVLGSLKCERCVFQALELVQRTLTKLVKCYFKLNPKLTKISNGGENMVIACKKTLTMEVLCRRRFTLAYLINNLVMCTFKSCLQRNEQSKLLEIVFG